ncbi:MAG: ABC transporter substrate-binding protein [Gammaproteobacteria bacterium]|nr:ABC transporter substrate-binding protein [Gammaproteobacteria bacterium]MDH5727411.1 ABC transporter substrate-binding protein [Gammaproteobacteria bacterium]
MMRVFCLLIILSFSSLLMAAGDPQALVVDSSNKVLEILKAQKTELKKNPEKIYDVVNQYVLPHFDFEKMSKWVLSRYWAKASAKEKQDFVNEFRHLLVRTYAASLLEYTDSKIKYLPLQGDLSSGKVTVRSEIDQAGGFPIPIDYRLHLKNDAWKVYDVKIDGISLIANYRTTFAKEIRQSNIRELINRLVEGNKQ